MQLSKQHLSQLTCDAVATPDTTLFALPEKVLQFGTGVLLRALPDYFIDKANSAGVFNGRIVVVKSTDAGDATAFEKQDSLYTLCIRGITENNHVEENRICSAISRVLSAKQQWADVLRCVHDPELNIIISNTTEVGIQYVAESVFQNPPLSFPAKLLAVLYERFKKLGNTEASKMVVLPTELLTDNGKKLSAIVAQLAHYNQLEAAFSTWLFENVFFCNTLVDCIVPGKPDSATADELEKKFGYHDALLVISEAYRLWAIEGGDGIKAALSFAETDNRIIIVPDITKYKELKLRLLNGTHTATCGLAYLAGINTVRDAMENKTFAAFITHLMLHEIAPAIPYPISTNEATEFGRQVLDRFRNPHLQHRWASITVQYSSKMAQRVVPVLLRYVELNNRVPEYFALGFAAYLLFMKGIKKEGDTFWGQSNGDFYRINDEQAAYYFDLWQSGSGDFVVHTVLQNEKAWGVDLTRIEGFEMAVNKNMHDLKNAGVLKTVEKLIAQE